MLAWGQKNGRSPLAWNRFGSMEARKRYARYIVARYSAFDVYFIVSGEWNAELRHHGDTPADSVIRMFETLGDTVREADPHRRMIGIHPMVHHGSSREFAACSWMDFGDYQQNYDRLNERIMTSRQAGRPVVNSEYAYYWRDSSGDGENDKENSFTPDDMRHSTWDIVMAGGYIVAGFGSTYFGGHRNSHPFDVDFDRNDEVEAHFTVLKGFFDSLQWWDLIPAPSLVASDTPQDPGQSEPIAGRKHPLPRPPRTTYWTLMNPGRLYVLYARGVSVPVTLELDATGGSFSAHLFNPRTGESSAQESIRIDRTFSWTPPGTNDWVMVLSREQA